ncbi:putative protease [Fusobacterium varium]|nr:putative protease [Fusobacterium varium]
MSSFIGSRSGNRGMCAQPCRKEYTDSKGNKGYFLSPKDQLLGYDEIQKLKEIGIESIKIEGRMKDPNYVFETVEYYHQMINEKEVEERVSEVFNRGYSKGYFNGADTSLINKNYSYNLGKEIGLIFGKELKLKDRVVLGDGIIYLSKDFEKLGGGYLNKIEVKGSKELRKSAEAGETIFLKDVPRGSKYIFRSFAKEVNDDIENKLKKYDQKLDITGEFFGNLGEKPLLKLEAVNNQGKKIQVEKVGENEVEAAVKKAATPEEIIEKLKESGESTFNITEIECHISEGIFLPVSVIKSLRRAATAELEKFIVESYRRKSGKRYQLPYEEDTEREIILSVITSNTAQEKIVKEYGIEKIYRRGYDIAREGMLKEQNLDSKLASNLYQLIKNKNNDVTVNWNLNISNRYTIEELAKLGKAETVILSPEISFEKIKEIGKTSLRKAILGYSKLKGMYVEIALFDKNREVLENSEGNRFTVIKNSIGNSEIFFERPLNILNDMEKMKKLCIDEIVIEFTTETPEEVREVLNNIKTRSGIYRAFNYERGVY